MSNATIYGFEIPHLKARPTRDVVLVQIPFPPQKSKGGIITPETARDMLAHNVMVGRIVAMGPLAFVYKDQDGEKRHDVKIGDWVEFRPFAGTMVSGGTVMMTSGYRYISTFNDVIAWIPATDMPDPGSLLWEPDSDAPAAKPVVADFGGGAREKVVLRKDN